MVLLDKEWRQAEKIANVTAKGLQTQEAEPWRHTHARLQDSQKEAKGQRQVAVAGGRGVVVIVDTGTIGLIIALGGLFNIQKGNHIRITLIV